MTCFGQFYTGFNLQVDVMQIVFVTRTPEGYRQPGTLRSLHDTIEIDVSVAGSVAALSV